MTTLLIGFENHKIELHVRTGDKEGSRFECMHTLIGHEDWIRDVDVCELSASQLLIASCSQDHYIRLWRLDSTPGTKQQSDAVIKVPARPERAEEDEDDEDEERQVDDEELKLKSSRFIVNSPHTSGYVEHSLSLESVLYGHEDWIYSVQFRPGGQQLVSASMDKTMVVWAWDEANGVWLDVARAGDIGGTTLGFYGARFDLSGEFVVAHGYQGALHMWRSNQTSSVRNLIIFVCFFVARFYINT